MSLKRMIKRLLFGKEKSYQERHLEETKTFIENVRKQGGTVGKNFDIYDTFFDTALFLVNIGDNVTITGATVLTHDACMGKFFHGGGYSKWGFITIGNDVFIGKGSILLPGTTIGNQVIVGAGAVVSGTVPDNSVICGNPAKVICTLDEYISKQEAQLEKYPTIHSKKELEERKSEIQEIGEYWLQHA